MFMTCSGLGFRISLKPETLLCQWLRVKCGCEISIRALFIVTYMRLMLGFCS